jgi:hypothetical protein
MKANQQTVTARPGDFFQEIIQPILGKGFRYGHHTVRAAGEGADGLSAKRKKCSLLRKRLHFANSRT